MNGNELNNMAQRYKDEMMRLYQKCGSRSEQSSTNTAVQNTAPETVTGGNTRIPAAMSPSSPGANSRETHVHTCHDHSVSPNMNPNANNNMNTGMNHCMGQNTPPQQGINVPVSCDCRFPSAESIIGDIAQIPVPLNPEASAYNQTYAANSQDMGAQNMQAVTASTTPSSNNNSSRSIVSDISGILLNMLPQNANYTVPSEAENEREILPNFTLPADVPADSERSVPDTSKTMPSLAWISSTGDNSWGYLQLDVFTAGGDYPVPGALVTVKKQLPGGSGLVRLLFTNRSGKTPTIALPAPSPYTANYPGSSTRPFSEYKITVRANGYYTLSDINMPIFAGVKTVQPIDLIPLPENQRPNLIQPRSGTDNSVG